jgi:aldehyde dehydrogenase (NAD+)
MQNVVNTQKDFFDRGQSRDISFRKEQLRKLKSILQDNEKKIYKALHADFNKPAFETYGTELLVTYKEIAHILSNLSSWAKPKKVSSSMLNFPSKSRIHHHPYGVVLVIGAWNYPVHLTIYPALGSMAAGNCTILKPSELAPHTSSLMAELINQNFDPGYLHVVEGGANETQSLLSHSPDYIFFTGSSRVEKIIMKSAAENLTPVTLELGGKSPAIVDDTVDLPLAAKRITWGKFINAGQTCVSPDYVYVHEHLKDEFCALVKENILEFYGDDPRKSEDYARILNRKHFERLNGLINPNKVLFGGDMNDDDLYIGPTVLAEISWEDPVMQEEIFGPILPVLTFGNMDQVISAIKSRPKPLALYIFSSDRDTQQRIIDEIPFGGGCINDTVTHLANLELPFGGIGQSGFGNYHGKASFDLFSYPKSIMKKSTWLDIPIRYPPYDGKMKWLKRIAKFI